MLVQAPTWTSLKNVCQAKQAKHKGPHTVCFHLYRMSRIGRWRQELIKWLPRVGEVKRKRGMTDNGSRAYIRGDEKIPKLFEGMVAKL